jgi:hypothetical protein
MRFSFSTYNTQTGQNLYADVTFYFAYVYQM